MKFKIALVIGIIFCTVSAQAEQREPLLIFAAASLKDVLEDVITQYETQTGNRAQISFAASSTLARQIQAKAPADIFISADRQWMEYVVDNSLVYNATLQAIASNSLVVIGHHSTPLKINLNNPNIFLSVLGNERVAMGDPLHVPSGRYAKAAFESLKIWKQIENKIIPTDNTRVALALVARREVPLGVVYQSDAQSDSRVQVLAKFEKHLHQTIEYLAAATKVGDRKRAEEFIKFLSTNDSQEKFLKAGFILIE